MHGGFFALTTVVGTAGSQPAIAAANALFSRQKNAFSPGR